MSHVTAHNDNSKWKQYLKTEYFSLLGPTRTKPVWIVFWTASLFKSWVKKETRIFQVPKYKCFWKRWENIQQNFKHCYKCNKEEGLGSNCKRINSCNSSGLLRRLERSGRRMLATPRRKLPNSVGSLWRQEGVHRH